MTTRRITPKATYEITLLDAARTVARLQAKRRRYRKLVREIDAELRHARKMLRALASRDDERRPDIAPSRLTNGATGYTRQALVGGRQINEVCEHGKERGQCDCWQALFDIEPFDYTALDASTRGQK